ncbi:hypothetical protein Q5752_003034 [Cryptotrichosporon argae]
MPTAWGDAPPLYNGPSSIINGTDQEKLDRYAIRELVEGWPTHRDAQEWPRFRALFADDGYVFTTWSGGCHIDKFIEVSKEGFKNGERIMHQCLGTTTELAGARAVAKLKTQITQRFELPAADGHGTVEVDVECQNRFTFLVEKVNGEWKTAYYKVFYEKDKMIPVDPRQLPRLDDAQLASMPYGYRYLGYCQAQLGHPVLKDLPLAKGEESDRLYEAHIAWLAGKDRETLDRLLKIDRGKQ